MLNGKDLNRKSILKPFITPSLGPQGLNYSNYDEFKSDILLFIKLLLYSSDFIKIIQFMETKIPNFFNSYTEFRLFLYKIQFFHSVLSDANKEQLDSFYKENIYPLISDNHRLNAIQNTLFGIARNPAIVRSRTYQQSWEECCRLFEIGIEKAIDEIYSAHQKSSDLLHSCKTTDKCQKCLDMSFYDENCWRMDTIEDDIWTRYTNSRKKSFEYTSSSDDDKKVNNYDLYMNKINKQMTRFDENCNMDNNNNNNNSNNINNTSYNLFESSELVLMDLENSNEYANEYANDNDNFNNNDNQFEKKEFFDNFPSTLCPPKEKDIISSLKDEIASYRTPATNFTADSKLKSITSFSIPSQVQTDNKKKNFSNYQFKFIKRENIDKKVLRKFRKYLKDCFKKHLTDINAIIQKSIFWFHFINENLLPPCSYSIEKKEFKSFNCGFMHWVFEHEYSKELYDIFLNEFGLNLINYFLQKFSLSPLDEEFAQMKYYINNLATIYGVTNTNGSNNNSTISDNTEYLFDENPINTQSNQPTNINININARTSTNMNSNMHNYNDNKAQDMSNVIMSNNETYKNKYGCLSINNNQSTDIFNELIKTKQRSKYSKSLGFLQAKNEYNNHDDINEYDQIEEEFMHDSD